MRRLWLAHQPCKSVSEHQENRVCEAANQRMPAAVRWALPANLSLDCAKASQSDLVTIPVRRVD